MNEVSNAEAKVVRLLALGFSGPQIAKELGIAHQTTRHHLNNVKQRIGIHNNILLTFYAIEKGIISYDEVVDQVKKMTTKSD